MDEFAEASVEPAPVSGRCPICDATFADLQPFRAHLADVHDLYDEEGAETEFLPPLLEPLALDDDRDPAAPAAAAEATTTAATWVAAMKGTKGATATAGEARPEDHRRRGLAVVLAFVVIAAAVAVLAIGRDHGTEGAATASTTTTLPAADEAVGGLATGRPGDDATAAVAPTSLEPTTAAAPAPETTDTTLPPDTALPSEPPVTEPVTTEPPVFVAPSAVDGRVDGCSRQGKSWVITYSWVFSGGAGWQAAPGEAATGDRYQATTSTPRNQSTTVTTVTVLDESGQPHDVPLQPPLSVSTC